MNPDRCIEENMALVVEIYVGEVGGALGVKFGDEILVTPAGPEILAHYPDAIELLS
jgi:Xaa-Pro aminopeptidase